MKVRRLFGFRKRGTVIKMGSPIVNVIWNPRVRRYPRIIERGPRARLSLASQSSALADPQGALNIHKGDNWGTIAQRQENPVSFLEQGEVDNFYYRVAIPCQLGLHVYFTSRLGRPGMITDVFFHVKDYQFIKQTLLDLTEFCPKAGSPKLKP